MSIGERIRKARLQAGLSQVRLAALLGVTRSACSQWELPAGTAPRRGRMIELARLLGVSYEWLATGSSADSYTPAGGTTVKYTEEEGSPGQPLSKDQKELVDLYCKLSPQSRSALLELLRSMPGIHAKTTVVLERICQLK